MADTAAEHEEKIAQISSALHGWLCNKLEGADNVRIDNFKAPDIGYSSETLLFDLAYEKKGEHFNEPLVVRMEPSGIPLFSRYDLLLQYRIMDTLKTSDVPVPTMRWFEEDTSLLGSPFYVMEQVAGKVPADNPPYHMEGMLLEMPAPDCTALWENAIAAMGKIHALNIDQYDLAFLDEPELGATPLLQHIQLYENHIEWGLDRERYPLLKTGLQWLMQNLPENEPVGLCWGDARVCNIIFQGTEVAAVLDWEMARLGNPLTDFGYWLVLDHCMSLGLGVEKMAPAPDEAASLALWEKVSGHSGENLLFYKIFAAWRFTMIMARVITREKMQGNLPEEDNYDVDNLGSQALQQLLEQAGVSGA
ncbi:MAG: phosphotransferase family protein [Halioglobus sp.]